MSAPAFRAGVRLSFLATIGQNFGRLAGAPYAPPRGSPSSEQDRPRDQNYPDDSVPKTVAYLKTPDAIKCKTQAHGLPRPVDMEQIKRCNDYGRHGHYTLQGQRY